MWEINLICLYGAPSTADTHSTLFRSLRSPFPKGDGLAARIRLMRLSVTGNSKSRPHRGRGTAVERERSEAERSRWKGLCNTYALSQTDAPTLATRLIFCYNKNKETFYTLSKKRGLYK